ncbi:MAG: hypothetical protein ABR881_02745 [Candidatus Sulfotelmatobacter sp.]|jgi:hypothetical protein
MTGSTHSMSRQTIVCCICTVPLPLETSRTDERGQGVHEECYVRKTISAFRAASTIQLPENWFNSILVRFQRKFGVTDNC